MDFLRNISLKDAYKIIFLSIISGLAGGALLILYPQASIHIFEQNNYFFYLIVIPPISFIFIFSKRLNQKKIANVLEENLEDQILSIVNTIRHDEFINFEKRKRADIYMSIVNSQTITKAAVKSIDSLEHYITLIFGWIYIFIYISSLFGFIILIWRLADFLFREAFQKNIKSIVFEESKEQKNLFKIFETHLYGFKELKFHKKKTEELFEKKFIPLIDKIKLLRLKSSFYASELMLSYALSVLILLSCSVFLFFTSFSREMSLKIAIMLLYMIKTDILILSQVAFVMEGKVALERFNQLFTKTSLKNKNKTLFFPSLESIKEVNSFTMENVHFSYPSLDSEAGFSLDVDNLSVKTGEILFIVGGNGSGKSTLMNIITGLYRPSSGKIKINDRFIQTSDHRYLFSTIFADFHLFDSIYGTMDMEDSKVNELLKSMNLMNKVSCKKGCFTTLNLSTGQKKRLALVTALLENKSIYIFDEWAADQDTHFRCYFYEKLLPMLKANGKIVIVVTHDDHYFYAADKVIKMEYGKIIERFIPEAKESENILSSKEDEQAKFLTGRRPIISRRKRKALKIDRKAQSTSVIEQFKQMLDSHRPLIKKLAFLLLMVSLSTVILFLIIVLSAHPDSIQSKDILFIQFIVLLVVYIISFRKLNKHFYKSVEDRIAEFRIGVLNRVRKTTLQTLEQIGKERVYTKLTSDIKAIADTSFSVLMSLLGAFRISITFIYFAFIYFPAFIIMSFLTFICGAFYSYNNSLMLQLFESLRTQERQLFESINHLLDGFKELRINNKKSDDFYLKSLKVNAAKLSELKLRSSYYYTNNYTIAYALWECMLLSLLFIMPFLTNSTSVLPIAVAMVLTLPINQIVDRYSQFHTAYMSLQQLYKFEDAMKELNPEELTDKLSLEEIDKYEELKFEDISFSYKTSDGHPFNVGPLSISFKPSEIIFITGGNGSGKSTLLKLITGLYQKNSGKIFFNNKEVDILLYQELFSAIFSDFYLFDRLYGMDNVDETKLNDLLKRFQLDKVVKYSEKGFNTLELSTGQKKRLSMVITILEDKPIYIFDEWAAEQDPHFRHFFYNTLLKEFKSQGKTVITVTHDDRFFNAADRVIKIDYGHII